MPDVEMQNVEDVKQEEKHPFEVLLEEADAVRESDAAKAERVYRQIIAADCTADQLKGVRAKELAIFALGGVLAQQKRTADIKALLDEIRPFFAIIAKSKTARIVRKLFDLVSESGCPLDDQIDLVENLITWARQEKRTFLRHRLQTRLGYLRFQNERYAEALQVVNNLLREVRRLDDKAMLLDVHVLESRIYYALKNQSKAKAALIAARTAAHTIYVAPLTQAEIDMQSGILGAEDRDYKISFSFFYEAFEGFHSTGEHKQEAAAALKYMLMTKILDGNVDDMPHVLQQKNVMQYRMLRSVKAMQEVASTYKTKDLHRFNTVREEYADVLGEDPVVKAHLEHLYQELLEQHLLRIIEPYSRVEIEHIAKLINLNKDLIESRLSQMILDRKLPGILDQANNCLLIKDTIDEDSTYPDALVSIEGLHKVVDALFDKCAGKFLKKDEEKEEKEKKDDKD
eukprot:Sspe_Gene.38069::Locus_18353_Transcript_1_1_Confidence_1.000_Length_1426::g.38069::m.38069/K03036/PSMD11, RPN6; 26S proteasome regulatory subunit N6